MKRVQEYFTRIRLYYIFIFTQYMYNIQNVSPHILKAKSQTATPFVVHNNISWFPYETRMHSSSHSTDSRWQNTITQPLQLASVRIEKEVKKKSPREMMSSSLLFREAELKSSPKMYVRNDWMGVFISLLEEKGVTFTINLQKI